ncbi:DUF6232 family protein [Aerosakkonemataceae cyanobacterium BLCC-F50]|uniref:DUF6232 family protein n=1 Tax=Floridaenema flaviceps BLCC-F50 TaxID=3153642 RepID=A0ABV4XMV2_9CYAN
MFGKVEKLFPSKAIYLNPTTLNSLQMITPQETLYDKGGIRITSTLLGNGNTSYRIRDLHRFTRSEEKVIVQQSRTDLVILGVLLLMFGLLLQPLALIIAIIMIILGSNSSFEQVEYVLTIITNKNQEIRIAKTSREEMNTIQEALERAIYYSAPGREGAN